MSLKQPPVAGQFLLSLQKKGSPPDTWKTYCQEEADQSHGKLLDQTGLLLIRRGRSPEDSLAEGKEKKEGERRSDGERGKGAVPSLRRR